MKMNFTVNNPKYWGAINRKANPWNAPPEILIHTHIKIGDNFLAPKKDKTSIQLKPLQIPVFEDIKTKKSALVFAKTSFGKSVVLVALHEVWGKKSLVLSHSLENVEYLQSQFKKFIGVEAGVVYTGKSEIKDVTITTYASFKSKIAEFEKYGFDNLIIDEADVAFTDKMRLTIGKLSFERLLGLTGTIQTTYDIIREYHDVKAPALEQFYQYMFKADYNMEDDPLQDVYVKDYEQTYFGDNDEPLSPHMWNKFEEVLNNDIERKKAQLEYIQEHHKKTDFTLVVFNRIADVEVFYKSAKKRNIKCYMNFGSQKKKERKEHMKEFKKTGGIMFAQYKTVGRGWDVPKLSKVFILFPLKSNVNVEQIIGRVRREYKDKKSYAFFWRDSSLSYQFKIKDLWKNKFRIEETIKREFKKTMIKV